MKIYLLFMLSFCYAYSDDRKIVEDSSEVTYSSRQYSSMSKDNWDYPITDLYPSKPKNRPNRPWMSLDGTESPDYHLNEDTSVSKNIAEIEETLENDANHDHLPPLPPTTTTPPLLTNQWSNGNVPYTIDERFYDQIIRSRIRQAMDDIQRISCVVFKEILIMPLFSANTDPLPWLHFTNPLKERECVHGLKRGIGGEKILILGFDCMQQRDIIHALLHALGFRDEVTHPQRDSHIRVLWQNIQPKYQYLFQIQNAPSAAQTLTEYDTMSIMHFHDRAYSINGAATITALIPSLIIRPSETLSVLDKMKLRLAYGKECNRRYVENLFNKCKQNPLIKCDKGDSENNYSFLGDDETDDADDNTNNIDEYTHNSQESEPCESNTMTIPENSHEIDEDSQNPVDKYDKGDSENNYTFLGDDEADDAYDNTNNIDKYTHNREYV